jgi:hypothetical protein
VTADVFGTRALRDRVLGTWRTDPARLREDANTEEDHARGYYRDRVVVELAQNAADAAVRGGVPGRLLLRLTTTASPDATGPDGAALPGADRGTGAGPAAADPGVVLVAANTGAPLDAADVASLAAMRASASRDRDAAPAGPGVVGRFGVGFAAVRAVADEIAVRSTSGAVRFSLAATARDLASAGADVPGLAQEVARRDGSLPALRLPREDAGRPPEGYDTAVLLTLRDDAAVTAVRAMLAEVADPLLLALPALTEIVVEDELSGTLRRVADVDRRWRRSTVEGVLDPALLAGRPVEERDRRGWRITWPAVVHAPTPTDDPLDLPALLVATLPLDATRRHVATGPATEALLDAAAEVYALLAQRVAEDGEDALRLVPRGLPAGAVDGALRERLVAALSRVPLLPSAGEPADGAPALVAPDRAVALAGDDGPLARALAPWFGGLVVLPPGGLAAARTLGVEVRDLAEVVEELPAADGLPVARWRALYAALAPVVADPAAREALAALPVPLADGRVVRGARGLLLPVGDGDLLAAAAEVLGRWGVRVVDPAAEHPVLERLGAVPADPAAVLAHPGVRQAVLDQADEDDLDLAAEISEAVLDLVAAALRDGAPPDAEEPVGPDRAVLGLLTLRAADGEPTPAHGLVLPGSVAERLLDPRVLAPVADVDRWGTAALLAVGVRADLVVVRVPEVVVGPAAGLLGAEDDTDLLADTLDGWEDYLAVLADHLGPGVGVEEVLAVADLDAVHPDAWPAVLARLSEPPLRRALLDPVRSPEAPGRTAPAYAAWWLRERAGLGLDAPFAVDGADPVLARLLPEAPAVLDGTDREVRRVLGGVGALAEVPLGAWGGLLRARTPVGGTVDASLAGAVWAAWAQRAHETATAATGPAAIDPAGTGDEVEVVPALVAPDRVALVHAEDAAVAPSPMWWQRTDLAAVLPAAPGTAEDLADLLDLPLLPDLAEGTVDQVDGDDAGDLVPTPAAALRVLPGAPATWVEHEALRVDGTPVDWWVEGEGPGAIVHAVHLAGLARGLAQAAGCWSARHLAEIALTDPERADLLAVERAADPQG